MRFEENNTTKNIGQKSCCVVCGCNYYPLMEPCPRCAEKAARDSRVTINCVDCNYSFLGHVGDDCPKCKGVQIEVKNSCMQAQQGGDHYQRGAIQPIEYIHANELNFFEGNAIKYVTRNRRKKSAVEDLKKAIHYIQLQLKLMHQIDSRIEYDAVSRD